MNGLIYIHLRFIARLVEKVRPDVKVFNIKFLTAPWYLSSMSKFYPDVYGKIKNEADEYLKVYRKRVVRLLPLNLQRLLKHS